MLDELVTRAFDAFNRRDLDGLLAIVQVREIRSQGDQAIVGFDVTATAAGSGIRIEQSYWRGGRA